MSRHLRHFAFAAAAAGACAVLTAGAATAATTTKPASATGLTIHQVLGGGHVSPYAGQTVTAVPGQVTDVISTGFYMQDPHPVGGPFKQAIEVYTGSKPAVTVTSTGNALLKPVVIGKNGVFPPAQNIFGGGPKSADVTTVSSFEPYARALDFYQGLDSAYVEVEDPVAIGPTNDYAFAVAPDNGAGAGLRTPAGGLADYGPKVVNSRRIEVYAPTGVTAPTVNTGDHFTGTIAGIMTEYEGNPELDMTASSATGISHGLTKQIVPAAKAGQLTVATYNLDNLSPTASASKYAALGSEIVKNLGSPDILAVQEIQDNDGATDDGVVDATTTMTDLVNAIKAAGGPAYSWTQIDPVNDQDGGQPGGNIRQVTMYRTDVGLTFDSIPGGGATVADSVTGHGSTVALTQSPGRIDPTAPAYNAGSTLTSPATSRTEPSSTSRKPLAAQFTWDGHTVFVINNHLDAKLEDDADFGRYQPPVLWSEIQRIQQTELVHSFVASIEKANPSAYVITLGDMNDQGFEPAITTLEQGGALVDTVSRLPLAKRYDYVFDGDSESLSGLLVSPALNRLVAFAAPVHFNADFAGQTSDHDPLLAYFSKP